MTVASSAKRMPALISDARTGNNCGGHTAGRLAAQAQPGRTGCAIQNTSKPRRTTQAATTGERMTPCVLMGMSPDYRSGTPVARRPRGQARRNGRHARQRSAVTASRCQRRVGGDRRRPARIVPSNATYVRCRTRANASRMGGTSIGGVWSMEQVPRRDASDRCCGQRQVEEVRPVARPASRSVFWLSALTEAEKGNSTRNCSS